MSKVENFPIIWAFFGVNERSEVSKIGPVGIVGKSLKNCLRTNF